MSSANRDALDKVTTGDFAGGGLLSDKQFEQFYQKVQDQTVLMPRIRIQPVDAPKGQIDKIGVGERLLREATEGESSGDSGLNSPNTGKIDYSVTKVELPWELSNETLEDTIEHENTANILLNKFTRQFGVDIEDLGANGDESSGDSFIGIEDGWIKLATDQGSPTYDHQNAAIDKSVFSNVRHLLDQKYKRTQNLVFVGSGSQKEEFEEYVTDRSTAAGDAMLMNGDDPTPFGYDWITPPSWPDDTIMFVDPQNLLFIPQRRQKVNMTTEGEAIVRRDLYAIYNMIARADFQIEEAEGVALATNIAAP
ncbi:phage major capsid protein [Halocalculus aciditolerans]|uniref:Phage major capsid protein n=1 Tax=Halocalculus aciditolerans TaxID=1383812 RepID=A0A830F4V5_9EURY|nr:phage major capsid protein [Halocalculus aciditolerans]GGL55112.1 hypothetical protein GCM10009039_11520 [Halocalculus aciditolerans]